MTDTHTPFRDEFLNPRHRTSFLWGYVLRRELLRAIRPFASSCGGRVLDIGCGIQPYRPLFTHVRSYVGVDVPRSPHSLPQGSVLYDGRRLPFADGQFDHCFSTEVLEHVEEPEAFLRECTRVLRKGGRLFVTAPFVFPVHEAPHDFSRWTSFGLANLGAGAGLAHVEVRPLGGYSATVAHVLGLYANHRLNRYYLRLWAYPLTWMLQKVLLLADHYDSSRDRNLFPIGWTLQGRRTG